MQGSFGGSRDRLSDLALRQLTAGTLLLVVDVVTVVVGASLFAENPAYYPSSHPEAFISLGIGSLVWAAGLGVYKTSAPVLARVLLVLAAWHVFSSQADLVARGADFKAAVDLCHPVISSINATVIRASDDCGMDEAGSGFAVVMTVGQLVVCVVVACFAKGYTTEVRRIRDDPLPLDALREVLTWCGAEDDDLVSLPEFLVYHAQLRSTSAHRNRLLCSNFSACDPHSAGVLPVKLFTAIYLITFEGLPLLDASDFEAVYQQASLQRNHTVLNTIPSRLRQRASISLQTDRTRTLESLQHNVRS
ncbi:hypothetical protein DIPPA_30263 [Diplonema papillatum]|nr:hypothetical protein DIPPA_30263 [Diplonema papillatum]